MRRNLNESQLLLEEKKPCDTRRKKGCTECMDDYFDKYDKGGPKPPEGGWKGVCGGMVRDDSDKRTVNESRLLSERADCWGRGKSGSGHCRLEQGSDSSTPGCMTYNECEATEKDDYSVFGGNRYCVRHNGNQSHGYTPGVNRCLEWSDSVIMQECCTAVDMDNNCVEWGPCPGESSGGLSIEMNEQIERIVREQAMMLGFGNTGGPGIGFDTAIATPTSKYEQYEEEDETELDENGGSYNININNQSADPDYTADGMGIFENIFRKNIRSYR